MIISLKGTEDSLNILKLCILYFDNITIQIPGFYNQENWFCIRNNFMEQLLYLEKYFDVKITFLEFDMPGYTSYKNRNLKFKSSLSRDIVISNANYIFDNCITNVDSFTKEIIYGHDTTIKDNEFKKFVAQTYKYYTDQIYNEYHINNDIIVNSGIGEIKYGMTFLEYYFDSLFYNLSNGKQTLSDLQIINDLLFKYFNKEEIIQVIKNQVNINCISILLPNLSNMTFDDIFEIRNKMKDELLELRYFLGSLTKNIDVENYSFNDEIKYKIDTSIRNMEYKMKGIKIHALQNFIREMKNPISYVPLLGSIFADIPSSITTLSSLGIIGANTGLEYLNEINKIKKDNLYFLFKLRNIW